MGRNKQEQEKDGICLAPGLLASLNVHFRRSAGIIWDLGEGQHPWEKSQSEPLIKDTSLSVKCIRFFLI